MARIIIYFIVAVQILGIALNMYDFDPRPVLKAPTLYNMVFLSLFVLVHLLALAGGILLVIGNRVGYLLSIAHHILITPLIMAPSAGFLLLTHDVVSAAVFYMTRPSASGIVFKWSVGTGTIFSQIARDIPYGATYIGVNVFALVCALLLWVMMKLADAAAAEETEETIEDEWQYREEQLNVKRRPPAPQEMPSRAADGMQRRPPQGQGAPRRPPEPPERW
jgi:hypothetical protein